MTIRCSTVLAMLMMALASALQVPTRPLPGIARVARSFMNENQPTGAAEPEKQVWNTALDQNGETYYWNSAGASQYEKPIDFDPSIAKNEGKYQVSAAALYDDEIPDGRIKYTDGTKKPELSNTMRDKLINESRGLGADPNAKNPFLYAFAAVGLFVLAGAATFTG